MDVVRNTRKIKGIMGTAVIGLCAWKQEELDFRVLERM